jgi:proline iminopeptidase
VSSKAAARAGRHCSPPEVGWYYNAAMSTRRDLFPPIEPYRTGQLRLDARHTMHWEESGSRQGPPVLFLHGGPGAGATAVHRRFFDPAFWRIVIFDQRGGGRSTPLGEIRDNTPAHLVDDIERLRQELGIAEWVVFGGSWGSTLALLYAQEHPERVVGLILRGIFLCRRSEIDWFLYGMRAVFPEAWRAFAAFLPEAERGDLLAGYYRRLTDPDPRVHMPAARAWSVYEGACSTLLPNPETVAAFGEDRLALGLARIEAHFFTSHLFPPERDLVARVGGIRHLPAVIVQGRYDMVCPIRGADELARAWPEAEYVIVRDAGHSAMEPGIREQLVLATERAKRW